jgi:hypothetical protein
MGTRAAEIGRKGRKKALSAQRYIGPSYIRVLSSLVVLCLYQICSMYSSVDCGSFYEAYNGTSVHRHERSITLSIDRKERL